MVFVNSLLQMLRLLLSILNIQSGLFPIFTRMGEATNTSHLEKVERGYENMDHYFVDFKKERGALNGIKFIAGNHVSCSLSLYPVASDKLMGLEDCVASVEVSICSVFFPSQSFCR